MMDKLLVASMLVAVASAGKCVEGKSKGVDKENSHCPQYTEDTCCADDAMYVKGTVSIDDGCMKATLSLPAGAISGQDAASFTGKSGDPDNFNTQTAVGIAAIATGNACSDKLSLLSCGSQCRPDYHDEFVKDGEVKLCKDFIEAIESDCEALTVCPAGENCIEDADKCVPVFSKDFEGKKFDKDILETIIKNTAGVGPTGKIKKVDGTDGCFNSAGRPSMLGASLAAVAGMFATGNAGVGAALGLATLVGSAHAADCAGDKKPKAREGSTTCPQYNDKSCCEANYFKFSGTAGDGCNGAEALGCADALKMASCGAECKPKYQDFLEVGEDQTVTLTVCQEYYDMVKEKCEEVRRCKVDDDNKPENCIADDSNCISAFAKPDKEKFDEDVFKARIAQMGGASALSIDKKNGDKCFNAAPQAVLTAAAVLAAAFVRM